MTCASLIAHYHVTYNYSAVQDISCLDMEAILFLQLYHAVIKAHSSHFLSFFQQSFTLLILLTDIY